MAPPITVPPPRRRWRVLAAVVAGVGATLLALAAYADTIRVDTFDYKTGQRTGYQIIDRQTGRVDVYDRLSNHIGTATIWPPPDAARPGQPVIVTPDVRPLK